MYCCWVRIQHLCVVCTAPCWVWFAATQAVEGADIIYTDTFVSMGDEDKKDEIMKVFAGLQIDSKLMGAANPGALFMHDMPAYRGIEVTSEVIDGPQSVIYDQVTSPQSHSLLFFYLSQCTPYTMLARCGRLQQHVCTSTSTSMHGWMHLLRQASNFVSGAKQPPFTYATQHRYTHQHPNHLMADTHFCCFGLCLCPHDFIALLCAQAENRQHGQKAVILNLMGVAVPDV